MPRALGRNLVMLFGAAALLWCQAVTPGQAVGKETKPPADDPEVALGRHDAGENDKRVRLVSDTAVVGRVARIGEELAAVARTLEVPATFGTSAVRRFDYSFKVVDGKDPSTYSFPGGPIYVNKGLLDFVHSDHELAGALAHEIAHIAHHHHMALIRKEKSIAHGALLPLSYGDILGRGSADRLAGALMSGQLYLLAKMGPYGIAAEMDADQTAARYLAQTRHNPVGILTLMERLAFDELRLPQFELGVYRMHPTAAERAAALRDELTKMGLAIDPHGVDPDARASVVMRPLNGTPIAEVWMGRVLVGRVAAGGGLSAEGRGKQFARRLNALLDRTVEVYDVRVLARGPRVLIRDSEVVEYAQADGDATRKSVAQMAMDTGDAIRRVIWQERFRRPRGTGSEDPSARPEGLRLKDGSEAEPAATVAVPRHGPALRPV